MKKNKWVIWVSVAVVLVVIVGATIRYNMPSLSLLVPLATANKEQPKEPPNGQSQIDPSDWQAFMIIDPVDTTHVFRVTWAQKYGEYRTEYCRLVFRNDKEKQYRLVAPWLHGLDIERQNMDDIKIDKIPIDSMPTGTAVVK